MTIVKGKFTREIDLAIDGVIGKEIIRYSCQFFVKGGKFGHKPFGSGVCLKISNNHFIVTASHVLEGQEELYVKGDGKFILIVGDSRETDIDNSNGLDLGYIKLDSSIIDSLRFNHDFLSLDKILGYHKLLDGSQYGVFGYPEKNIKVIDGKVSTGGAYYMLPTLSSKVYEHYGLSEKLIIILKFAGRGEDMKAGGRSGKITDPYGISGCGIWYILSKEMENGFSVDYKLIGIISEGKKKYHSIIGSRIEVLLNAMNHFGDINIKMKK